MLRKLVYFDKNKQFISYKISYKLIFELNIIINVISKISYNWSKNFRNPSNLEISLI